MTRTLPVLVPFFFASVLVGPWWVSIGVGILIASLSQRYIPLIFGGMLMDMLFGAPVPAFFDFSFLYTAMFTLIAICAFYFRDRILE